MKNSAPLVQGNFGQPGAGNLLRLILAALLLTLQGFILAGKVVIPSDRVGGWMPLVIAVILILLNFAYAAARGNFNLFADRLEITRGGKTTTFLLQDIATVEFNRKSFALRDKENKLMVRIFHGAETTPGGWLWLLLEYREALTAGVLNELKLAATAEPEIVAVRYFAYPEAGDQFADAGFVLNAAGTWWFFPSADAVKVHTRKPGYTTLNDSLSAQVQPVRFFPSPDSIPMHTLVKSIAESTLPETEKNGLLALLAENHGGMTLEPGAEKGIFAGSFAEFSIRVETSLAD